jgi:fructose/tagatose bisphosphate aldolase
MASDLMNEFVKLLDNSIDLQNGEVKVTKPDVFRSKVPLLAEISALESGARQGMARFLVRAAAQDLGVAPASINDLYMARGKGQVPFNFTVPAMNLRVLSFDAARAIFRTALKMEAASIIFEIARSEMNYTDQKPTEYATSILAAAVAEGYKGPVFIQGDHFQASAKKYLANPQAELESLQALIKEAVAAGFLNIDVDTSTLVDLEQTSVPAQQKNNVEVSALLTAYIRKVEPKGVTISVGGEIGEVGGHNSTEEELCAYLGGYKLELAKLAPGAIGLSKISIQTGTSHGGVVLPDGTIAKVTVDFNTLLHLSRVTRDQFGMGGAVQHGASTLPEDAFGKFVEAEACEVHLATNFMNIFYDHIPADFREEIYAYLREKSAGDRKPDMTDEQFYYKTRKSAIGPFKAKSWRLPSDIKAEIIKAWEEQFNQLFNHLGLKGTRAYVDRFVKIPNIKPNLKDYLGETAETGDVSDLAD